MVQIRDAVRRVDWRFLLHDPQLTSVVTLDVDDELLTEGLRCVGATLASADVAPRGAPVVFVRDPDDDRLGRAIELRAVNGAIVVQMTTRRARWVVDRRLRRAGLRVQTYGAWPSCSNATRHVPLRDRSELAASARAAKNRQRRALGMLLTNLRLGPLVFAESTSIATADDQSASPAPVRVAFGDGRDAAGTATLLTPRFASSRHVIAMVTDRSHRQLVAKTPRIPGDDEQFHAEVRGLTSITDGGPPRPRLVTDSAQFGQRWLVQTRIDGEPLSRRHVARHPERWSGAASRWLNEMPTGASSTPDADGRSDRLIRPALDVLAACAHREPELRRLLDDAERAFEFSRSVALPIVCEHGDFRPPNLIITGPEDIAAVDWELAERHGLPLHDLRFFHTYVAEVVPGLRPALRRSALDALRDLGIELEMFESLASLASLRQLASEATRLSGERCGQSRAVADSAIARAWFRELQAAATDGDPEAASV